MRPPLLNVFIMLITVEGKRVGLTHKAVTRRNEVLMRDAYTRSTEFLSTHVVSTWQERVAKAITKAPDLLDYLRPDGGYNESEIMRIAQRIIDAAAAAGSENIPTMEQATKVAAERVLADYQKYLAAVPDIARLLYFSPEDWPVTRAGLDKGIELIVMTADPASMPEWLAQKWESITPNSDVWMDASAAEVAAYVNAFREAYGGAAAPHLASGDVGGVDNRETRQVGVSSERRTLGSVGTEDVPLPTTTTSEGAGRSAGAGGAVEHASNGSSEYAVG